MSRSIHTIFKNLKGLTKNEIMEQAIDPNSDLNKLAKKSLLKKQLRKKEKDNRQKTLNK